MSIARHHNEWLDLIEVSGPFLSLPVLLRVFPQGLDAHDPTLSRGLRLAYEEWADNQQGLRPDPAIHTAWVAFVLSDVLGFPREVLHSGPAISEWIKAVEPNHGETLRPDLVIQRAGRPPRLLVTVQPPTQGLNKPQQGRRWSASPETRMAELLRGSGVALGLVTNGERWTLVHTRSGATMTCASWEASFWLEEPLTLRAFRSLLGVDRTLGSPDSQTLEALLVESANNQHEVTEQLGVQVLRAVEVLVRAQDRIDRDQHRRLLAGISEPALYEAALTVMMRLVFLLSAEERGLLLLGRETYDRHYAVSTLRAQLHESAGKLGEEVLERRFDAWSRLLATFRLVHAGIQYEDLRLPAYGGRLFDPDRFPFLEGRAAGSCWRETAASPPPVDNRTVLHLLEALQVLRVSVPGGPPEARQISFKTLEVEQIGHVYEGLLDHTVRRADEPVLHLVGARSQNPTIALSALRTALLVKAQPRASQTQQLSFDAELSAPDSPADSETLLALLSEQTGRSASALRTALTTAPRPHDLTALRTACENDPQLFAAVRPYINLLYRDSFGRFPIYTAGCWYVASGPDRRASGAYYTPRSLTEPIVAHTLDPLVYEPPEPGEPSSARRLRPAAAILALKICDMAVGSGAFLVQACRYLGARLAEATAERDTSPSTDQALELLFDTPDPEERLARAKQLVADRCLYGVDKNHLAVEIAQLSLWLEIFQRDRPFTFLDHAIKCGDALLGIYQPSQIDGLFRAAKSEQRHLFEQLVKYTFAKAWELRRKMRVLPIRDRHDAQHKQDQEQAIQEVLKDAKLSADLLTTLAFIRQEKIRTKKLNDWLIDYSELLSLRAWNEPNSRPVSEQRASYLYDELHRQAQELLKHQQPFHWPLEFPEVFIGQWQVFEDYVAHITSGTPWDKQALRRFGFSAIVGNPPFQGGQKITGALGVPYRDYLVEHIAHGQRGSADLCVYFFLRGSEIVQEDGVLGLLATNTIAQGDSREVGLDQIVARGFSIPRAVSSQPWPGTSALEIAQVWLKRGAWTGPCVLDGEPVSAISSFLSKASSAPRTPQRLAANAGHSFIGSYVLGMGFVLTPEEAQRLIARNPRNREVLFPYLNGEDLNTRPDQSPSRWVINFHDWPLDRAQTYLEPFHIVREQVKPERDNNTRTQRRERWWQYAERAPALYSAIAGMERLLVITIISRSVAFTFVPNRQVYAHKLAVFPFDKAAHFAVLQSGLHHHWAWQYSSTMKSDLNYSPADVFETFPFPAPLAGKGEGLHSPEPRTLDPDPLEQIGEAYHEHRRQLMLARQEGLTKTYNRFHDQREAGADIAELRRLHVEMDQAVAAAYGWTDLDLGHGFHQTRQGLRYTISEPARRTVLDRLLLLNHQRYAEEVGLGLHDKGAKKASGSGVRRRPLKKPEGQSELF